MSCRRSEHDTTSPGDRADSEQLLSSVLRSTGGGRPSPDDHASTAEADDEAATLPGDSRRPPDANGGRSEQIVLRELGPAQSSAMTADNARKTRDSSIAASLLQALSDGARRTGFTTSTAPPTRGRTVSQDDGADVIDITDAVHAVDESAGDGPTLVDADTDEGSEDTDTDAGDADPSATDRTARADDTERIGDSDHIKAPDQTDPSATDRTARADDTERIGDSDHKEAPDTAPAAHGAEVDERPASAPGADHPMDAPISIADMVDARTLSSGPAVDTPPSPKDAPADPSDERASLRSRLRETFREMGAWTAVAQLALLAIGLLCVSQVVVLLVVLRFLLLATTQDTTSAADVLVAYGRAIDVMLPALVVGALGVAAFAIGCVRRAPDGGPSNTRLLGVPVSLWAMIVAAGAVAVIVMADTSSTVEQASQMTSFAIAACTLLGVAAFIAPHSITVRTPNDDAETDNDRSTVDATAMADNDTTATPDDADHTASSDEGPATDDNSAAPDGGPLAESSDSDDVRSEERDVSAV